MRPHQVLAYDGDGNVIATLDILSPNDPETGEALGTVDFGAMEEAGMKLRNAWEVNGAVGSGTWPEFLGAAAHDFRVELEGKKIARLVHHRSKHVRHRSQVEDAISARVAAVKQPKLRKGMEVTLEGKIVVDLRDIVGGPGKALQLDENGRTRAKNKAERPALLHLNANQGADPNAGGPS